MKPPEKIFIVLRHDGARLASLEEADISEYTNRFNMDDRSIREYHLAPQWVSVKDRLPDTDMEIWIFDGKNVQIGFYEWIDTDDEFGSPLSYRDFVNRWDESIKCVAWAYLTRPAPPEGAMDALYGETDGN